MKMKCTKWFSVLLALLLLSLAAMPALAAETDSTQHAKTADAINKAEVAYGDSKFTSATADDEAEVKTRYSAFHKEADQSPTAALNDVTDNSELEALSGGAGESYHCYWVTDETGQRILGDMTAGETYVYHLYLRCSGRSGKPVRDVTVQVLLWPTEYSAVFRGETDLFYTDELGARYCLKLTDLRTNFLGFNCVPITTTVAAQTLTGEPLDTTGDLFGSGLHLDQIENGREHAIEITFCFKTEPAAQNTDAKTSNTGIETQPDPEVQATPTSEPSPKDPNTPQVEVITQAELGAIEITRKELYTEATLPNVNTMNSVTDNPEWGDEREFLQITNLTTGESSRTHMILESGYLYEVEIYLRNDSALGRNYMQATLSAPLPLQLEAGAASDFTATITSQDAAPGLISANLRLLSREDLTLKYLQDSAATAVKSRKTAISDYQTLLTGDYAIGSVYGALSNAKHITYTIAAVAERSDTALSSDDWENAVADFQRASGITGADNPTQAPTAKATETESATNGEILLSAFALLILIMLIVLSVFSGRGHSAPTAKSAASSALNAQPREEESQPSDQPKKE